MLHRAAASNLLFDSSAFLIQLLRCHFSAEALADASCDLCKASASAAKLVCNSSHSFKRSGASPIACITANAPVSPDDAAFTAAADVEFVAAQSSTKLLRERAGARDRQVNQCLRCFALGAVTIIILLMISTFLSHLGVSKGETCLNLPGNLSGQISSVNTDTDTDTHTHTHTHLSLIHI